MEEKEGRKKMGRPRKAERPQTQVVFYVEASVLELIDDAAYTADMARSEWIRAAVKEKLEREAPQILPGPQG